MFNLSQETLNANNAIHTATEIHQQPDVWEEAFASVNEKQRQFIQSIVNKHSQLRVILTGAGTSAFAGDTLVPMLNKAHGGQVQFEGGATTSIVSNPEAYLHKDIPTVMVSFARSGNSPESVATVALGEDMIDSFYQVVITCNKDGKLAQNIKNDDNSITVLMPEKSNDKSLAMTSSFSGMVLAAYALFAPEPVSKQTVQNVAQTGRKLLETIPDTIEDMLTFPFDRVVYLGSGLLAALSHEASLKMLELTGGQVFAMHETSLGFRHGPKSVITEQSVIVVFLSEDAYTRQYDMDILREVGSDDSGMKVIAVCETTDSEIEQLADWVISLDTGEAGLDNDLFRALAYIIFGQTLAMKKSLQLGLTPDNPSPDGVINRVVQGVTIYPYHNA